MIGHIAAVCVGSVALDAASEWRARRATRRATYELALARSKAVKKPLIVVGDPDGGMTHGDYGYGDLCVDLTGCPKAPVGIKQSLEQPLPFAPNSHVLFCCYVIELCNDIERAFLNMKRVAGRNLFVLALRPDEIAAYRYPGTKWIVSSAPMGDDRPLVAQRIIKRSFGTRLGEKQVIR